jgi:hypothetical protein
MPAFTPDMGNPSTGSDAAARKSVSRSKRKGGNAQPSDVNPSRRGSADAPERRVSHDARSAAERPQKNCTHKATASSNKIGGAAAQAEKSEKAAAEKKPMRPELQTTVMMRNLPESYTRNKLQDLLDQYGFKGQYDFIYMPMNFRTKASFGYAFVNFIGHMEAQCCADEFQGFTSWDVESEKVCDVSWSEMHQGHVEHIDRYRNSPVMHESVPDEYKPAVFIGGTGDRAQFPPPTKKLRMPRIRRTGAEGDADGDGDGDVLGGT